MTLRITGIGFILVAVGLVFITSANPTALKEDQSPIVILLLAIGLLSLSPTFYKMWSSIRASSKRRQAEESEARIAELERAHAERMLMQNSSTRRVLADVPTKFSPVGLALTDDIRNALAILDNAYLVRYNEELEKGVDNALDSISAKGEAGISVLLERLFRDMKVVGSNLQVQFGGDLAWNEWLKKQSVTKALGRARAETAVPKLTILLDIQSTVSQFYEILHPAVIAALGEIGSEQAVASLQSALKSPKISNKAVAAIREALGRSQEKHPAQETAKNVVGHTVVPATVDINGTLAVVEDANLVPGNAELEQRVDTALDSISAKGETGINVLLERLYRDMTVVGADLQVQFGGDLAWNEWLKKQRIAKALGRARAETAVPKLVRLLHVQSTVSQFYEILQPAVIAALAEIGNPQAIASLQSALKSPSTLNKAVAAIREALEQSQEKHPAQETAKNMVEPVGIPVKEASTGSPAELWNAMKEKDLPKIKRLIESGVNVNALHEGKPLIFYAVALGEERAPEILDLLLQKGAKINAVGNDVGKRTALDWAASYGNIGAVRKLLERGADVNPVNGIGMTPLQGAKMQGHSEIVELLRSRGGR